MPVIPAIQEFAGELTIIRRDLHANPELGFEEVRTSAIVAKQLEAMGIEVHKGIAKTGVVGILKGNKPGNRRIGLRADMDALPMDEETNLPFRSTNPGVFHGCGHDGHTTILLGTARYLAQTRDFAGTAIFIFQPAEEGLGGARGMIGEGLFDRFPCDEVYGFHNAPDSDYGVVGIKPGPAMAGGDFFDITIKGVGSHGAMPHQSRDPVLIATQLVQSLQSIVSRNIRPTDPAVVSVTQIHGGAAYNVVPAACTISGTIRFFSDSVAEQIRHRMRQLAAGMALAHEIEIEVDFRNIFSVLDNDPALSEAMISAAGEVVGTDQASIKDNLVMGSEDFSDMLRAVPGAYCTIGHKGDVPVHNPGFVFDDDILPVAASIMARLVERRLGAG